jgi:hypothetical protein
MSKAQKRGFGDGTSPRTPGGNAIGKSRRERVAVNLTVNGRLRPDEGRTADDAA